MQDGRVRHVTVAVSLRISQVCGHLRHRYSAPVRLGSCLALSLPPTAVPIERLPLPLNPFEFPRPFDTPDTPPFLIHVPSEMLSNTLFGMEGTPFDTFDTLAVLKQTLANSDRMAFWGPQMTLWGHKTYGNSDRMAFWWCFVVFFS